MQCEAISFELNPADAAINTMAKSGTRCSEDYIEIEGSNQGGVGHVNLMDRYCGGRLNNQGDDFLNDAKIKDCTAPFRVGVITDDTTDGTPATTLGHNSGVCLEYIQEPCSNGNQGP